MKHTLRWITSDMKAKGIGRLIDLLVGAQLHHVRVALAPTHFFGISHQLEAPLLVEGNHGELAL